ncbi:MAG: rhomboid family intramembrane serine protease [bacterium]
MKHISYNSPVVLTFSFLSMGALLMNYITGGLSNTLLFSVYRAPLTDPFTYLRFFGHVLGHAGWEHYIGNISLILVLGPLLEEKYGSRPLLWGIGFTALVSGLVQFIFFPGTALLGASGIVFMMIVLSSLGNFRKDTIPLTLILVGVFYIGGEIVNGILSADNVSQLTHVIGGVCGGIFGYAMKG